MNIAIDARKLDELGIGTYIRGLMGGLSRIPLREHYRVLVTPEHRDEVPAPLEPFVLDLPNHGITEVFRLGRLIERLDVDVFHSPYVSVPRTNRPCVVNLHDAITQQFPSRNPVAAAYFAYMNRRAARRADRIVTGTFAAKQDIIDVIGCRADKIVVAYDAVDEIFFREDIPPCTDRGRYFLYVGGDGPHKNLAGLLKAFAIVRKNDPSLNLVLTGRRFSRLGRHEGVATTGFVSREELVSLYRGAVALVMPSFVEGFGLPVIEAMAARTPAITSTAAALVEISGDAALHEDPHSPPALAETMMQVANDRELAARMVAAGSERVRNFTWESCARATRDVYLELALKDVRRS